MQQIETEPKIDQHYNVWKSVRALASNRTYIGLIIEQVAYIMMVTSFASFLPIYVRTVFENESQGKAFIAGGMIAMGAVVGLIFGTVLQHFFYFRTVRNLRFSLVTATLTLIFMGSLFIRCPNTDYAGVNLLYPISDVSHRNPRLTDTCNRRCVCSQDNFDPVCYESSSGDLSYFSTCFAGCNFTNKTGGYDCGCVPESNSTKGGGWVRREQCDSKCPWQRLWAFLIGVTWCAIFIYIRLNPMQQCLLRCIPYKDRVVGLTMSALISRLFGAVPAPLILAWILRDSCGAWRTVCDEEIVCVWRYKEQLTNRVAAAAFLIICVGIIGLILANISFKDKCGSDLGCIDKILPFLYLGSLRDSLDPEQIENKGIKHVVRILQDCGTSMDVEESLPLNYLQIGVNWVTEQPDWATLLPQICIFIHQHRVNHEAVLVHCRSGKHRSPTVVAAYLAVVTGRTIKECYQVVEKLHDEARGERINNYQVQLENIDFGPIRNTLQQRFGLLNSDQIALAEILTPKT